jgi:hypothetical protein
MPAFAGHLGGLPLGEEDVYERLGLVGKQALAEEFGLLVDAGVKGQRRGRLDRLERLGRGHEAARLFLQRFAHGGQGGGVSLAVAQLVRQITGPPR